MAEKKTIQWEKSKDYKYFGFDKDMNLIFELYPSLTKLDDAYLYDYTRNVVYKVVGTSDGIKKSGVDNAVNLAYNIANGQYSPGKFRHVNIDLRESEKKRNERKMMDNKKIRWENDLSSYAKGEFMWHYTGYVNDGVCAFELYEKRFGKYLYDNIHKKVIPVATKEHGEEVAARILRGESPDVLKRELKTKPSQIPLPLDIPTTPSKPKPKKDTSEVIDKIKALIKKL